MPKHFIQTKRLDLHLITPEELIAVGDSAQREHAFKLRSFKNPYGVLTQESLPHQNRIDDVARNPANIMWYYRLIVDRETQTLVGSTSFHEPPNEVGMIEIGIGITESQRDKGFATEAVAGMWLWAKTMPQVTALRYSVSPLNKPSMAIIARFGFPMIGTQEDPEDGLEFIYELPASDFRSPL